MGNLLHCGDAARKSDTRHSGRICARCSSELHRGQLHQCGNSTGGVNSSKSPSTSTTAFPYVFKLGRNSSRKPSNDNQINKRQNQLSTKPELPPRNKLAIKSLGSISSQSKVHHQSPNAQSTVSTAKASPSSWTGQVYSSINNKTIFVNTQSALSYPRPTATPTTLVRLSSVDHAPHIRKATISSSQKDVSIKNRKYPLPVTASKTPVLRTPLKDRLSPAKMVTKMGSGVKTTAGGQANMSRTRPKSTKR